MMKLFKKAYVSIEIVIIAAIVLIGGLAGTSAFLKNGQNAQGQSATAINDTINMIDEEFSFSVGGGEIPDGGSDEETNGLNEYGFYFGKKYSNLMCMVDDPTECFMVSYVFYTDGSMERYLDDELNITSTAGTFRYEDGKALASTNNYEFISNGTIMRAIGSTTEYELAQ